MEKMSNSFEKGRKSSKSTDAPDGGWGWAVVASGHISELFFDGFTGSLAVLLVTLKEYFGAGAGKVSLIASIGLFVFHCSGPVSTSISERVGARRTAMTGALMVSTALFISGFVNDIMVLCFTVGVLTNFGLSLSYLPTFALLGKYFHKRHGLANGIATAGYGLGVMGMPPLCQTLIQYYGWHGTFVVLAGLGANLCVAAALLRPLPAAAGAGNRENRATANRENSCVRFASLFGFDIIYLQPSIIGISLAMVFLGSSNGTFLTFLLQRADDIGISRMDSSLLMTAVGASSFAIRAIQGWFVDLRIISPMHIFIGSIFLWAVLLLAFTFVVDYWVAVLFCVCFGLTSGLYNSLHFVVFKDAVHGDHLASAFGLDIFSMGVGCLIGISIAGALYDLTGTADVTFYTSSICALLSAIILGITSFAERRCKKFAGNRDGPVLEDAVSKYTAKYKPCDSVLRDQETMTIHERVSVL